MNKTQNKILTPIITLLLFLLFSFEVGAIGIMSQPIEIDNALRGQVIKEELKILNNNPKNSSFGLIATGDIKDWTSFIYNEEIVDSVEIATNTREIVGVEIKIPEDIPNDSYAGSLQVEYRPLDEKEDGVSASVIQRVSREVFIDVTGEEIVALRSSVSPDKYVVRLGDPLIIKANYYNEGNISLRPDLQVKISQDDEVIHNFIYPYPEEESPVEPRGEKKLETSYSLADLSSGKYQVETKVLVKNQEEEKEDDFAFTIVELDNSLGLPLTNLWLPGSILLIILSILSLSLVFKKDLKPNKKKYNKRGSYNR